MKYTVNKKETTVEYATTPKLNGWEEEFDKRFTWGGILNHLDNDNAKDMKDFIHQAILSAEARAREKYEQEFKSSLELWMDTHSKLDKPFTTDELIKFMEQK